MILLRHASAKKVVKGIVQYMPRYGEFEVPFIVTKNAFLLLSFSWQFYS